MPESGTAELPPADHGAACAPDGAGLANEPRARQEDRAVCDLALVTDRAAFDALGREWADLFARGGRPHQVFQTFDWLWHWANHYLDDGASLSIVTGRCEGRLALVWPLVSSRVLGLRILSFMGEPVGQYGDALVEDRPDAAILLAHALDFVTKLPIDVLWLRRVRGDAALAAVLGRGAGRTGAAVQAPYVDFAGATDIVSFENRLSAKFRSGQRRHLRRLEAIGPVAFERHGPGAQAPALVRLAIGFKRDWAVQNGRIAPTIFDPRLESFFADAASGDGRGPDLRVSVMACAGEPIGVEISLACKGWLFGHVLAPKPGFEKQGAGALLAGHSIASATEEGFGGYDLLAPADRYKMEWASGCIEVRDFALARSFAGRIFKWIWIDFGRDACRSIAKSLPPSLVRLLIGRAA